MHGPPAYHVYSKMVIFASFMILASYILGCQKVNEEMTYIIFGLCWMDKDTLIVANYQGEKLVKYTINTAARTCTGEVMDSGYKAYHLSCSEDGKVYVTELESGNIIIRVYDENTGHKEVWDTKIQSENNRPVISLNNELIIISTGSLSYVFSKDRVFQYKLTHHQLSKYFRQTYLTDTGVFWGAEVNGGKGAFITNLLTNDTVISKDVKTEAVAGTRKGYVYVTDYNRADVGVYSLNGTFLNHLQIDPPVGGGQLFYSGAVRLSDDEALIAFSTWNGETPIAVYKTHQ